ncbi:hypothetical protein [Prosthecobacter sp.]|uniref:hypothetical protein n=1 Tax=Prosthecobacter sp. TaxID=1965333 RepID=UPI002ABB7C45|nr:hypothetical protein [Prosthecobacter sp.]MDZ4403781.1 hypothetical protein [Prosthecobacter sp.]
MALDLWIYGPGFGETNVLVWDSPCDAADAPAKRAAVVDNHGGKTDALQPALQCLKAQGCPPVELVAATHPHLDHLRNFDRLLNRPELEPETVFWWGGQDDTMHEKWYLKLAEHPDIRGREPGKAALMSGRFIQVARKLAGHDGLGGKARLCTPMGGDGAVFELKGMTVSAISPWEKPKQDFCNDFRNQFEEVNGETVARPVKVASNRVSLGLVFEHQSKQVLLGGDMEEANWLAWRRWQKKHGVALRPAVIKVSHHGSETGTLPDMWENGFFESLKEAAEAGEPPLCVITPWRVGGRRLPVEEVVTSIRKAGCRVILTGTPEGAKGLELKNRYPESFAHIRIEDDGTTRYCEDSKLCTDLEPLI